MPELSVIIPVYKTEAYLVRCLDSVCSQTLTDLEIVCVDDASPDGSRKILEDFASRDSRIRLILLDENGGVSAARNRGICAANGEWIGFVDSDDFVDQSFFEKLLAEGKSSGADIVKGSAYTYDDRTGESGSIGWLDTNGRCRLNKAYFTAGFFTAIYKASLLREGNISFPEGVKYFEESAFVIEAVQKCRCFRLVDDAVYHYVFAPSSIIRSVPDVSLLDSLKKGTDLTMRMLRDIDASLEDRVIVCRYVLSVLMMFIQRMDVDFAFLSNVSGQIADLLKECPDSEAMFVGYYLGLRQGFNM